MNFLSGVNNVDLMNSITVMWQSMLAIFVVMAVIAVIVYLFTKVSK